MYTIANDIIDIGHEYLNSTKVSSVKIGLWIYDKNIQS